MSKRLLFVSVAAAALSAGAQHAFAVTELQWWHAMAGANNEVVEKLSKEFNESQSEYKIVPVFKGTYPEALNAGIAAFRAKQPPAILQVFDAGSGVMMGAEGAVMPAAQVLEKGGYKFDKSEYLPGIVAYYSKPDGRCCPSPTTPLRRSFTTTRMSSRRPASIRRRRRKPGLMSSRQPRRSRRVAQPPAA